MLTRVNICQHVFGQKVDSAQCARMAKKIKDFWRKSHSFRSEIALITIAMGFYGTYNVHRVYTLRKSGIKYSYYAKICAKSINWEISVSKISQILGENDKKIAVFGHNFWIYWKNRKMARLRHVNFEAITVRSNLVTISRRWGRGSALF